ncbi:MAG TPA: flagellar protein FlaG [Zoogloea sp.]|uniref:flagellar protein FlaG n=1 Tax=Zoogloea sp. TaxID=49181 RepID=UPI002CA084DC|nr:flagellar protein FlaG [Zoogloea sp.]HMV17511.1 flagellar protein FlaG [Rhodocyclaceae bacterium]HMV62237.1 flagellar protein FlaG [Rhodocyclaceae bacterium]HMW50783.1 flagellar protein FlaG [Rhodocyclaceae bacterium]HMY48267.1 flagellar protein FlaG [Rhodocyclaceae bacterium]HMZ74955.1 flagellar protein FlaG [Rhodocyclaceae bacterium]
MSIQPVGGASTQPYTPPVQSTPGAQGAIRKADAPTAPGDVQAVRDATQNPAAPPTPEQLNQAVKQIQDVIKQTAQSLQFSIDKDSGMTVVKVVDTESKKVIRQIPSEEVMAIAKALDKLQGLLVKQQA